MKFHDVEQNTKEWRKLRAGIPTASEFSKIITRTGKPSRSQDRLMCDLIAERMLNRPLSTYQSWDMSIGVEREEEAVRFYEFLNDVKTRPGGFVTNDAGTIGASPDRWVDDDGILEIKCPSEGVHVSYLLGKAVEQDYFVQTQGQLWLCGREWVDIQSYFPELPHAHIRQERDEKYIKLLAGAVTAFSQHLEEQWEKLEKQLDLGKPEEPTEDWLGVSQEDVDAMFSHA